MSIASLKAALQRIPVPMLGHEMADYDQLVEIITAIEERFETIDPGGDTPVTAVDGTPGLDITLAPYSADRAGVSDCSTILDQAIEDGHRAIWFPAGRYRFAATINVPAGVSLHGSNDGAVVIEAEDDYWVELLTDDASLDANWGRCEVHNFAIEMAIGGIRAHGNGHSLSNLRLAGGTAGSWAIELHAARYCALRDIHGGYGTGVNVLAANGIRIYGLDDVTEQGVNYGWHLLQNVTLKGSGADWRGILAEHLSSTTGVIRDLQLARVRIEAPSIESGSIGIELARVQDSSFTNCLVSDMTTGWRLSSGSATYPTQGNSFTASAGRANTTNFADTNGTTGGSVRRNSYIGCGEWGPVGALSEGGYCDLILPAGLWFSPPGSQAPRTAVRVTENGHLVIADKNKEGSDPYDSAEDFLQPRRALAIDVGTDDDYARIYRPSGYTGGQESRIIIGNGQGFSVPDGGGTLAIGPAHRVGIADPCYLLPWTIAPGGLGATTQNIMIHATDKAAINSPSSGRWMGPGLYTLNDDATEAERTAGTRVFVPLWVPINKNPGFFSSRPSITTLSAAVDRRWFGQLRNVNSASNASFTIPPDLIRAEEEVNNTNKTGAWWKYRRGGSGTVTFTPDSGVTVYDATGTASVASVALSANKVVTFHYIRTGAATATVFVEGN